MALHKLHVALCARRICTRLNNYKILVTVKCETGVRSIADSEIDHYLRDCRHGEFSHINHTEFSSAMGNEQEMKE